MLARCAWRIDMDQNFLSFKVSIDLLRLETNHWGTGKLYKSNRNCYYNYTLLCLKVQINYFFISFLLKHWKYKSNEIGVHGLIISLSSDIYLKKIIIRFREEQLVI